jgi:hypothetical protein
MARQRGYCTSSDCADGVATLRIGLAGQGLSKRTSGHDRCLKKAHADHTHKKGPRLDFDPVLVRGPRPVVAPTGT